MKSFLQPFFSHESQVIANPNDVIARSILLQRLVRFVRNQRSLSEDNASELYVSMLEAWDFFWPNLPKKEGELSFALIRKIDSFRKRAYRKTQKEKSAISTHCFWYSFPEDYGVESSMVWPCLPLIQSCAIALSYNLPMDPRTKLYFEDLLRANGKKKEDYYQILWKKKRKNAKITEELERKIFLYGRLLLEKPNSIRSETYRKLRRNHESILYQRRQKPILSIRDISFLTGMSRRSLSKAIFLAKAEILKSNSDFQKTA